MPVLTLTLAALGVAAVELAIAEPGRPEAEPIARASAGMALVILCRFVVTRREGRGGASIGRGLTTILTFAPLIVLIMFLWPFLEQVGRLAIGRALMLEVVTLGAFRNLGLGLAVFSARPVFARLAVLVALFAVLLGASMVEGSTITALVGLFAVVGPIWLISTYWNGLPIRSHSRRSLPGLGALLSLGVVGAIAGAAAIGPSGVSRVLAGLVPSSGGTDWPDPDARGGVNDGPNEVTGQNDPKSVGYTQSEIYLDSDKPSLYDAFNDMYGEPYKKKKTERAIAISAEEVRKQGDHPTENLRAGREFPTVRRRPPPNRPADIATEALVYVKGRVPLHLRMAAYDVFDGHSWIEAPPANLRRPIYEQDGSPWLRLDPDKIPASGGTIKHQFKIGKLDARVVPSPPHLTWFRVGSVDQADFFGWAQDQILKMADRTIPGGTVVETQALTVDPARLSAVSFPAGLNYALPRYRAVPESPILVELARRWAEEEPHGWGQIEAIVEGLKSHCVHDRDCQAPEDCPDVLAHFLEDARRGPDYLFATTSALMLRSLGYPTRVISGFYADPKRFDPFSRHTPIVAQDVHFWVEVQLPNGPWIAIEPTPGYELMPPAYSVREQLVKALVWAGQWTARNANGLFLGLSGLGLVVWFRRELLDRLSTLAWRFSIAGRSSRGTVLRTLRLLERRSRWAGRPRPIGWTPSRWYGTISSTAAPDLRADLEGLLQLADWSLYAPEGEAQGEDSPPLCNEPDLRAICRRAVQGWTLRTFRAQARADSSHTPGKVLPT
ncbi:transglutaminase-like domain-containing protein [soil metagenome]